MQLESRAAHAVQFQILKQVGPVLRHDAIAPVSNAKLAINMLGHGTQEQRERTSARRERLLSDADQWLDDAVATLRDFDGWFNDRGAVDELHTVLCVCRRLLFAQLRAGPKLVLPEESDERRLVPVFGARYVLLSWLLNSLQRMPADGTLHLDYVGETGLRAWVEGGVAAPACAEGEQALSLDDVHELTQQLGWHVQGDHHAWQATLPPL